MKYILREKYGFVEAHVILWPGFTLCYDLYLQKSQVYCTS